MVEINDKEASMLVTLIYMPKIEENWSKSGRGYTVEKLIRDVEHTIKDEPDKEKLAAEMNKAEFQDVLNQIKASEKLMSLTVENIEDNKQTNFRAMTLTAPTNAENPQSDKNPIIVFQGTAGNYQWDDIVFNGMLENIEFNKSKDLLCFQLKAYSLSHEMFPDSEEGNAFVSASKRSVKQLSSVKSNMKYLRNREGLGLYMDEQELNISAGMDNAEIVMNRDGSVRIEALDSISINPGANLTVV